VCECESCVRNINNSIVLQSECAQWRPRPPTPALLAPPPDRPLGGSSEHRRTRVVPTPPN